MDKFTYKTSGVCSRSIDIEIEDGVIISAKYTGGCHGNTQGISALVVGMSVDEAIKRLSDFFFKELGLQSTFTEVGIKREDFGLMAKKACRYGDIKGFKTLTEQDVVNIFEMCM